MYSRVICKLVINDILMSFLHCKAHSTAIHKRYINSIIIIIIISLYTIPDSKMVDGSHIRKEKVADSKISRYVWTGPNLARKTKKNVAERKIVIQYL